MLVFVGGNGQVVGVVGREGAGTKNGCSFEPGKGFFCNFWQN